MSQGLLHHLENSAMSLLDETIDDVRAHGGPAISQVPDDELRIALYTLLLKIADLMRSGKAGIPEQPATARDLFLRQARETMEWVDSQSSYTAGHTRKVVRHVGQMAARMNLSDAEIQELEAAAWVHNLGLLAQVGHGAHLAEVGRRLSSEELRRARNHTVLGAEMIRPYPFLSHLVPIVRYHHHPYERQSATANGLRSGEPSGDVLPLGARLIAVADAYQAMLEPRAYRPALSRREALDELIKGAGTQFDPKLVPFAHELGG